MTIPRLRRTAPEPVHFPDETLDAFADALAETDDPVRAGQSLGLGPARAAAAMLALRRRMGDQAG
jgi:hypothetical protein